MTRADRAFSELPLPPSVQSKLAGAGFATVGDLDGLQPAELAAELSIEPREAARLLAQVRSCSETQPRDAAVTKTARQLLDEERASVHLSTFVKDLDLLLGGGVALRQLTEFAGVPGIGKTQLGMQLAVNVHVPVAFGGLGGEAVYIDSEGSFLAERVAEMARALLTHLHMLAERGRQPAQLQAVAALDLNHLLAGIHCFRVHDAAEQLAVVRRLPEFLLQRPRVRLLVIDSIAFHFRHGATGDASKRLQMLGQVTQCLTDVAAKQPLAAVLINQVTTRVNNATNTSALAPALGESWGHACNVQLMLQWRDGEREARLYKGAAPGVARYRVSELGVRGMPAASQHGTKRAADELDQ